MKKTVLKRGGIVFCDVCDTQGSFVFVCDKCDCSIDPDEEMYCDYSNEGKHYCENCGDE